MGAAKAGVVIIPVIWRLAPPEIAFILEDSGAQMLFVDGALAETARTERLRREAARAHPHERTVPVDEVEDGYADGECPDRRCGIVQVSRDGGTHDTHKGDRDVGDDVRNG